jgi:flagellar biosynthesis protein FlhG
MLDQANDLRLLVRQTLPRWAPLAPRPKLVVVAAGKGGVGTTTLAVNLAVTLAQQQGRTVLVDADPHAPDAAVLCRLADRATVADVLDSRRTVPEALQPGPGGIRVLPGAWDAGRAWQCPSAAEQQLVEQLRGLGGSAEFVVIDTGNSASGMARRLWQAARAVLLVTTTELASVMDTYALLKALMAGDDLVPVQLVVNMARDGRAAKGVEARLGRTCRRFLGIQLGAMHWIPPAQEVARAAQQGEPFVLAAPRRLAAQGLRRLAEALAAGFGDSEPGRVGPVAAPRSGRACAVRT